MTSAQWENQQNQRAPTPVPSNASQKDHLSQLRELAELRDKGILTEDEFNKQKAKILGT